MSYDLSQIFDALIQGFYNMDNIILTLEGMQISLLELELLALGCGSIIDLVANIISIPDIDEIYSDYDD